MISRYPNLGAPHRMGYMTSPATPVGSAWASITTRQASPFMPSDAGGRPWEASDLQRTQPADHRRLRRQQRRTGSVVEARTARSGRRTWPHHHRLSSTAWNEQMEQDRASAILVHHPELARQAPGELPNHRTTDRRHHNARRTQRQSRDRQWHLPIRYQSHGRRDGHTEYQPTRIPWRVELHDQQKGAACEQQSNHQKRAQHAISAMVNQHRCVRLKVDQRCPVQAIQSSHAQRGSLDRQQIDHRRGDRVRPHRRAERERPVVRPVRNGVCNTRSRRAWCIQ